MKTLVKLGYEQSSMTREEPNKNADARQERSTEREDEGVRGHTRRAFENKRGLITLSKAHIALFKCP